MDQAVLTDIEPATPAPTLTEIEAARARIGDRVLTTPVHRWRGGLADRLTPAELWLKLELFQVTGTFKPRGALLNVMALDADQRARGVCAVSAGNHAIATAFAAQAQGTTAKVVMLAKSSPVRVAKCRSYGAEVVIAEDVHRGFDAVKEIERAEGRTLIHPFEGPIVARGTATVGLEFMRQVPDLDAVVVPVGGGGLIAGIAAAVKAINPDCAVVGVEPEGADTLSRSLAAGEPVRIDQVNTIADSLGAPYAAAYSFGLARQFVDRVVTISDDEMRAGMALLFHEMKLAVEPAGAATTAGLLGPLREPLAGKRVGLIVCGANIDLASFARHVEAGETVLDGLTGPRPS